MPFWLLDFIWFLSSVLFSFQHKYSVHILLDIYLKFSFVFSDHRWHFILYFIDYAFISSMQKYLINKHMENFQPK